MIYCGCVVAEDGKATRRNVKSWKEMGFRAGGEFYEKCLLMKS
jgi:hypothetical protein